MRRNLLIVATLSLLPGCPGDDSVAGDGGSSTDGGSSDTMSITTSVTTISPDSSGGDDGMTGDSTDTMSMDDSTTSSTMCGNDAIDGDEECDGTDLGGEDCVSQGADEGTLGCNADCTFDTSMCIMYACGNDMVEGREVCDGTDLAGSDCVMEGFDEGTLGCDDNCMAFDTSMCASCGDDAVGGTEVCDGTDLAGEDCTTQGFDEGTLGCAADCSGYDTSMCASCGDDAVGGTEACDGTDLAGEDCTTQGFDEGTLGCNADCTFDTSMCAMCGDDMIGGTEVCDGTDLAGEDCSTQGFDSGTLGCAADCSGLDTSGCGTCGDATANGDEECDAADLAGADCVSLGFDGGTLGCAGDCSYDTSGCFNCGDGMVGTGETCDGANLGGLTDCTDLGFDSGTLGCAADCGSYDTSMCAFPLTVCSTPAAPLGPNDGDTTVDSLTLPPIGDFVGDVNVLVDANHTWVGDLTIDVVHTDSGTGVRVENQICGSGDDILASFDQDAAAAPACGTPIAVDGGVLPFQSLDQFTGIPDGPTSWDLVIVDHANQDGGTLNGWCIQLEQAGGDPNNCGDGIATFAEACDGADLRNQTCQGLGYLAGGTLGCDATCNFDESACDGSEGVCGDSVIQNDGVGPDEFCDTNELAGQQCEDLGFVGGSLSCQFPSCGFDTSQCSNNVIAVCNTGLGLPIGPNADTVTTDTITLADLGTVGDIDVYIDALHTFDGDMDIQLINENTGTAVFLATDDCGTNEDMQAYFNDEGNIAAPDCVLPIAIEGDIIPEESLSAMDGLAIASGWTLSITDDANLDQGVLNDWCIYITPQ